MSKPIRLAYQVFGSHSRTKSPILILHGMFGSSNNWRHLGKALASKAETVVYALDSRNHGNSDHIMKMDYHLMCKDTVEFCKEHQLEKMILIGHSMGGKTAMVLALSYPQLVRKLVVVDVAPVRAPGTGETEDMLQAMRNLKLSSLQNRKEADTAIQSSIPNPSIRNFLLTNLIRRAAKDGGLRWKFNLDVIANNILTLKDFPSQNTSFNGPTIFIGGEKSNYITVDNSAEIKRLFPEAEIVHIADAGHWVHVEKPKEFLDVIKNFIS